jgi:hypothetical protein
MSDIPADPVAYLLEDDGLVVVIDKWRADDPNQSWDDLARRVAKYCRNLWRPSGWTLQYSYERMRDGKWVP